MDHTQPNEAFETALTKRLEQAPHADVPADFALRVRAALPPVPARRRNLNAGRIAGLAAIVVIAAVLFVLAPHAQPSLTSFAFCLEMLLICELGAIAYWLGVKRSWNE